MKQLLAKAFRKNTASAARRMSTSLSNNQIYPQACLDASNDYRAFNSFRKNRIYNQILEHVPEEQGKAYLELISGHAAILDSMDLFKSNDDYGGPRMYHYPKVGLISPSTLRYVKVLCDLKMHFQTLDGLSICEIGVGYGGQCRVINAYFRPRAYTLIDIQPALALAQRYLDN
jgi:hypothetical protein